MSSTEPGSVLLSRRFATLVAFEVRGLRALTFALLGASVVLLTGALLTVPVHLEPLSSAHRIAVSAFALLAGLPLVAQVFGGSERDSAAETFRAAPLASGWSALAKMVALALCWATLWATTLLVTAAAKGLGPVPSELGGIDIASAFDHPSMELMLALMGGAAYFAAALTAMASRHALAAALGGLVAAALPWALLFVFDRYRESSVLAMLSWAEFATALRVPPVGGASSLAVVLFVFRLRGRGSRSSPRRALRAVAACLALFLSLPALGWTARSLLPNAPFDDPRTRVLHVAVHPTLPLAAASTFDSDEWLPSTTLWSLDPRAGTATRLPDPASRPFYLAAAQELDSWFYWSSSSARLFGSFCFGPDGPDRRSFALDTEGHAVERVDYRRFLTEVADRGWSVERVTAAAPGEARRFRISRPGIAPMSVAAEGRPEFDARRIGIAHYLDAESRLHRLDALAGEDRVLDLGPLTGRLMLHGSPDGRWYIVSERDGSAMRLLDTWTERHEALELRNWTWTKRDRPILERVGDGGTSWRLHGLGEPLDFETETPFSRLHDFDGELWLAEARGHTIVVLETLGALARRME